MACGRAARRSEASALSNRTPIARIIGYPRFAARPQLGPPFAGCTSILVGTRTAPRWAASSCSIDRDHVLALRAVDGWLEGNSYRNIAQGLFGKPRIPDRGWKTHDLRSRTIRLVQMGLRLMRGGYRDLLRHKGKDRDDTS
ncbi:DUF2285 domain-containing protein [Bradyrhizobium sp. CCBAU 45394]|uniref:DUF2285 domain-containing protein n=1 Tax=Bradyrhizobium sp. CCBAU 45394 TaxID=1325087 RepID=UPI002304CAE2|nr:DUF2285 domain-containing protein [Bradyrhizobium sp. CCBAU 45394]